MHSFANPAPLPARKSGYIPTLDGWRAIAIAMVLLIHTPGLPNNPILTRIAARGGLGVDLFFAISGLLICSRLLEEERLSGRISLPGFYARRAFRIFPPAYLYLGILAIAMLVHWLPAAWGSWTSATLFLRNYYGATIGDNMLARPTTHFWSLAVEEHFYLLLPALLVFFPRHRKQVLGFLTLAAFAWVIAFLCLSPAPRHAVWERRTDLRLQSLLFPAWLALFLAAPRTRAWFTRYVTPRAIGLILLLGLAAGAAKHFLHRGDPLEPVFVYASDAALDPPETSYSPLEVFLVPVFFPFIILSTVLHPTSLLGRFLEWRPLRSIGRISYSLYLWQMVLWVDHGTGRWRFAHMNSLAAGIPLTVLMAVASYFLIEKPAIRVGHRFAPPATPGHANLATDRGSKLTA